MVNSEIRLNEQLLAETNREDGEIILKARNEVGRGKRFGMSGEIQMGEEEAEAFAKWVFANELEE